MSYHSSLTLESCLEALVLQNIHNKETDDLSYNKVHPLGVVLLEAGKQAKLLPWRESPSGPK